MSSDQTTTPLLVLLDGILSQDEERTRDALTELQESVPMLPVVETRTLLQSAHALESIIDALMVHRPHLAQIPSDHDGSLPLHFAASIGIVRVAELLMERYPDAALKPNRKGKIALHYAAREGRPDMVSFILEKAPQAASILSKKKKLALHFAAGEGHLDIVKDLLRVDPKGASVPSGKGKIPLHFAARWGHMDVAHELCRIWPETVSALDYEGSLPLHDAAREGQLEMARFLVERDPQGLSVENIRGETPLFPAVRSGNVDLCAFMVQTYPKGGKHVVQRARYDDNVQEWAEGLLDLCLRGAVDNFNGCQWEQVDHDVFEESSYRGTFQPLAYETPSANSTSDEAMMIPEMNEVHSDSGCSKRFVRLSVEDSDHNNCSNESLSLPAAATTEGPKIDINLPRSKSPILEEASSSSSETRKKRSVDANGGVDSKRARKGSFDEDAEFEDDPLSFSGTHYNTLMARRPFLQVHAALECGASQPVIECVLARHAGQLEQADGFGRLPLHLAVEHLQDLSSSSSSTVVSFIIEKIWKPYQAACAQRDYLGRLPLHLAILAKADCRIIASLLESNPRSGVQPYTTVDTRCNGKLPIHLATEYDCDVSSIYMLLRGDPSIVRSWKPTTTMMEF